MSITPARPLPALQRLALASSVARRVGMARGVGTALSAFRMVWASGGYTSGSGLGGPWGAYLGSGAFGLYGTLPGSQTNLIFEAGDPELNSALSICANWIGKQTAEPRLRVYRWVRKRNRRSGELEKVKEEVEGHPLIQLLSRPNQDYDGAALWDRTSKNYQVAGNAYLLVTKRGAGGRGAAAELWVAQWWEVRPRYPTTGTEFITDYLYRSAGRGPGIAVPAEDVIHFRFGLNPYDGGRTGQSPSFPILRSVVTDNEAETYHAALLKGMGIVPYAVMPASDDPMAVITPESKKELEEAWVSKFTGDGRGKPFVSSRQVKIEQLGLSPEDLAVTDARQEAIRRICGSMGIHPVLVGLGADTPGGFDNGGQHKTIRRAAYEDCLTPMLNRFAQTLQHVLMPELGDPERETVEWDYSEVPCFQDDRDALFKRLDQSYKAGWLQRGEAREEAGLWVDPDGGDDVYLTDLIKPSLGAGAGVPPDGETPAEANGKQPARAGR